MSWVEKPFYMSISFPLKFLLNPELCPKACNSLWDIPDLLERLSDGPLGIKTSKCFCEGPKRLDLSSCVCDILQGHWKTLF